MRSRRTLPRRPRAPVHVLSPRHGGRTSLLGFKRFRSVERSQIFFFFSTSEVFLRAFPQLLALSFFLPRAPRSLSPFLVVLLLSTRADVARPERCPPHLEPRRSLISPAFSPTAGCRVPSCSASRAPSSCAAWLLTARHVTLKVGEVSLQALDRAEHLQMTGLKNKTKPA